MNPPVPPPFLPPSLRSIVHRAPPEWGVAPWASPRGAGRRPGRQRGGWPRLQAAANGAAIVAVVERAAAALELVIVQQALVRGLQLLHAFLQPPAFLARSLLQASLLPLQSLFLLHPLHVAVAQVHLCQVRHDEANDQHALAGQPHLAAEGDDPEAIEQQKAY
eukprot:scaffold12354_cov54-Phaeocystis_antarctica.AAC.3